MAIKGSYSQFVSDDISFFMDEVAERGGFVVISTAGSGQAVDQGEAVVTYASNPSGKIPLGVLMCDMVNKDLTQTHLNHHKNEVQKGGKVHVRTAGDIVTNMIYPSQTPAGGSPAYAGPSGLFQTNYVNTAATPVAGTFLSSKDADGYVKVKIKTN